MMPQGTNRRSFLRGAISAALAVATPAFAGIVTQSGPKLRGYTFGGGGDGAVPTATFTANVGSDPGITTSEPFFYGEAHLTPEGMFIDMNTGDHGVSDNAVRGFNPHSSSKTDATGASRSSLTGWKRSPTQIGTAYTQYDNIPSVVMASENKYLQFGSNGCLFNLATGTFAYANASPSPSLTSFWANFMHRRPQDVAANPNDDFFIGNWLFNSQFQWLAALDMAYFGGGFPGGAGNPGLQQHWRVERTVPADGVSQPWKLREFTWPSGMTAANQQLRNNIAAVGPYIYRISDSRRLWRIDVRVMTSATELATRPNLGSEYYSNLVYVPRWNGLMWVGADAVLFYDISTNTWTDITPSGMQHMHGWHGDYVDELNAAFFRGGLNFDGGSPDYSQSPQWRKIALSAPAASRWTLVQQSSAANPFYPGAKHVRPMWDPVKERVYTLGGDYSNGNNQFGQPTEGANFTTNQPSGAQTYQCASSLRNDMFSIDPYGAGTQSWRLEHPYLPANVGGSPESRPPRPDQASFFWDSLRQKRWVLFHVIRMSEFGYGVGHSGDVWADGDLVSGEPGGIYSFVPGASGSPGAFTRETTKRLVYRQSATSYSGDLLISGIGDERIGQFEYDALNDVGACLSASNGGGQALFTFHPAAALAGGTTAQIMQYRTFSASGYNRMDVSCSYCAIVDGWAHAVALATTTGGTRKCVMLRVNVTAALAVANEGGISGAAIEVIDLPWSLSPGSVWETNGDASAKWQEHCGVIAVDRKIVLIKSYEGIIEDGVTKAEIWDPDTRRFTRVETPPENFSANAWGALPKTGEVLCCHNTNGYDANKAWRLRVR